MYQDHNLVPRILYNVQQEMYIFTLAAFDALQICPQGIGDITTLPVARPVSR
jgi:hypothetical protein